MLLFFNWLKVQETKIYKSHKTLFLQNIGLAIDFFSFQLPCNSANDFMSITIDKTYTAQVTNVRKDVMDFFEFKDNKCIVKIEGDVKILKNNSRYEFLGTIYINNKKYKYDDKNTFVSTKVQLDKNDVFLGMNNDYSSTYKGDEVTEYNISIRHDINYNFIEINIFESTSDSNPTICTLTF